jgi:choline-sulfatase
MNEPLSPTQRADTYMSQLQESGYHTALIGKHHFIDCYGQNIDVVEQNDTVLKDYGYDHVWQVLDDGENRHNEDRFTRHLNELGELDRYRRLMGDWEDCPYAPENVADGYIGEQTRSYLEAYGNDRPFYLHASFVGPHPPYHWVPEEFDTFEASDAPDPIGVDDPEEVESIKETRASYMGKVSLIDHYVGEFVDALKSQGRMENTIVILTSDHGDMLGDDGIFDKRRFLEPSVRVPLIAAGPGMDRGEAARRQGGGRVRKELVSLSDIYPTMLDAAGIDSIHGDETRDGISLFQLIEEPRTYRRECVHSELGTTMMVRDGTHKLVFDPERGGSMKLFDLRTDDQERTNLVGMHDSRDRREDLLATICGRLVRQSTSTHVKEQQRIQDVRV